MAPSVLLEEPPALDEVFEHQSLSEEAVVHLIATMDQRLGLSDLR
jgi:hypothetical protein